MQNSVEIEKSMLVESPQSEQKFRKEPDFMPAESSSSFLNYLDCSIELLNSIESITQCIKIEQGEQLFNNIVSRRFARVLLEIRLRLSHTVGSLIKFATSAFASITLLFGLSNSRISEILTAYFGTSLSRIPTC